MKIDAKFLSKPKPVMYKNCNSHAGFVGFEIKHCLTLEN